jgi:hypothetical protein
VIVGLEKGRSHSQLFHVGCAGYSPGSGSGGGQCREQEGGQYGYNRNDHQQFNQGEGRSVTDGLGTLEVIFLRLNFQVFHMTISF